jgi:hypothetical protein
LAWESLSQGRLQKHASPSENPGNLKYLFPGEVSQNKGGHIASGRTTNAEPQSVELIGPQVLFHRSQAIMTPQTTTSLHPDFPKTKFKVIMDNNPPIGREFKELTRCS